MTDKAMTVGELIELLQQFNTDQKLVFSDVYYGDFDLTGATGTLLSNDNFVTDFRPILRLEKRID